jgi:hypothetical protein
MAHVKPLLTLLKVNSDQVYALAIQQVLALCGDGELGDHSRCSEDLREYLTIAPSETLSGYLDSCLHSTFDKSGFVLQDIVNELGRRLDYSVDNGVYQGRSNVIGSDGIWRAPDGHAIVVEVKTSDAYRINLDRIAGYRTELANAKKVDADHSSSLIVVGRQDTGDLEAQVRGSKHAWSLRLISVDALMKLVTLKEKTEEDSVAKIHDLLRPFEYTRLDKIIDIAFRVAEDATAVVEEQDLADLQDDSYNETRDVSKKQEHTPADVLAKLRQEIVAAIGEREQALLVKRGGVLYWSADKGLRVIVSVSKQYANGNYWYAYHPHWDKFLSEARTGFFVLGCVGRSKAYMLPFEWIHQRLKFLHTTERNTKMYWHIQVEEPRPGGELVLRMYKGGDDEPLDAFSLSLAN